ncbi:hypothetical protein AVEN_117349-1 [Araneus ventricosus]|uniref:Uncharacterized protein n=1 Tax=Araneus ventricosus TaxID=182803 RepID=A0A4Y2HZ38_ARAVE|nr:hypothetical protein AVEN_117349-1 [Araneus ventricosus]
MMEKLLADRSTMIVVGHCTRTFLRARVTLMTCSTLFLSAFPLNWKKTRTELEYVCTTQLLSMYFRLLIAPPVICITNYLSNTNHMCIPGLRDKHLPASVAQKIGEEDAGSSVVLVM